ncbi:hypothetical protein BCR36DRAFT_416325 [Piromyces finnis]|uniref:SEC7 domain-containing protein n=1 Tax=Piromyces finnis TaxID=1754191 RepID=A0A1Y1UVF1_9FUNG|nr:hypothetical protein BCR36DRAFT_416325 [Piromyces finnis]|eukprot:ORX42018.1 hypothetical protein BCR36DRAFT_416325 [Piromyces finnis]
MKGVNFQKMAIDKALRSFLLNYALPVEAQEIDRVIKSFADKYYLDNPTIYNTADYPYILAYSLIMLNTDLHNPKVKNKITVKQFISNVEHSEIKYSIPREILEIIYDNIKVSEFISQNQLHSAGINKKKNGMLHRSLSILIKKNSTINTSSTLLDKHEKQIFDITKYENSYDIALDLEYSIMSLANIKIELSSYIYVNQYDLCNLSYMLDDSSSCYSSDKNINSYQYSQRSYQSSPLATQNYDFNNIYNERDSDEYLLNGDNEDMIINYWKEEDILEDANIEKINDGSNIQEQKKKQKSIDNSDIVQMLFKNKNNEHMEKERKSKLLCSPLVGKGYLSIANSRVSSLIGDIDHYKDKDNLTYVDLKSTQSMLLVNKPTDSTDEIYDYCNARNETTSNNYSSFNSFMDEYKKDLVSSSTESGVSYSVSNNTTNENKSLFMLNEDENRLSNMKQQHNTSQLNLKNTLSKNEKSNKTTSKLVIQLKEGKMKKGLFCDKNGKYIWNGKLSTYWVVLCEDRLILFSNWKWFENNNKSDSQKKDQSMIINVPKVSYIIPLINGICVYSNFEFKDRFIFHLCFDKKDILFEVETKESMIEWMNSINFLSSFVSANLNPLKCNRNIKSCDSLNKSISNLENEVNLILNDEFEEFETYPDDTFKGNLIDKDNKCNDNVNYEKESESKLNSSEKMNNNINNNEDNNNNSASKEEDNKYNNNNNSIIIPPKEDFSSLSDIQYIEFENDNLLEYYIKDVIEKYEIKNMEYLKNIQEYKKLYSQYIILSPISKISRQKCNDQLIKIIKQIRKNKIFYERYSCYIYFLKNCFEVDVTSNSNIYREVEKTGVEETELINTIDDVNQNPYISSSSA